MLVSCWANLLLVGWPSHPWLDGSQLKWAFINAFAHTHQNLSTNNPNGAGISSFFHHKTLQWTECTWYLIWPVGLWALGILFMWHSLWMSPERLLNSLFSCPLDAYLECEMKLPSPFQQGWRVSLYLQSFFFATKEAGSFQLATEARAAEQRWRRLVTKTSPRAMTLTFSLFFISCVVLGKNRA